VLPLLPRFLFSEQRLEDERRVAQAILEAGDGEVPALRAGVTAGGDRRRARGVPIIGRGIGGTALGTDPLSSVMRKESAENLPTQLSDESALIACNRHSHAVSLGVPPNGSECPAWLGKPVLYRLSYVRACWILAPR
jgi:hypothetical protein